MIRRGPRGQCLLLLLTLTACGDSGSGDHPELPVPRDTYVAVMAELAQLRRRPPPARGAPERERLADSARSEILARHGISAEDLVRFADAAGRDPTLMMEVSQAIAALSDSIDVELATGNRSDPTESLEQDPASNASTRSPPPRGDSSLAAPPASDPAPAPRFADPARDIDREPERPQRDSIRRPARSRPQW